MEARWDSFPVPNFYGGAPTLAEIITPLPTGRSSWQLTWCSPAHTQLSTGAAAALQRHPRLTAPLRDCQLLWARARQIPQTQNTWPDTALRATQMAAWPLKKAVWKTNLLRKWILQTSIMQVKSYQTVAKELIAFIPHLTPLTDDFNHLALH